MKGKSDKRLVADAVKRANTRSKLKALAERPGTAGEGAAAAAALDRLNGRGNALDPLANLLVASRERVVGLQKSHAERRGPKREGRKVKQPGAAERAEKAASPKNAKKPVRLSNEFVKGLPLGEMWWDADSKATGFGVRTYPGGGRSFFLDYRIDGRQRRITIGPFPRWSAEAARERAKELRRLIDRGHDPAGAKRERREAPTVQDLIDRYLTDHLPKKSADKARVADEKRMLAEIGHLLGKHTKVVDVHGGDIADMHRRISESIGRGGKPRMVRANRIFDVCSKMFSLALVPRAGETLPWRNAVLGNPCRGVEQNPEEGRERFYSAGELAAISDALTEYPGVAADCVRLIMLTGCRPSEAMKATWPEFDNEPGYWIKPSAHVKQRKTHKLPLSPAAIELLERLRAKRSASIHVFPGDVVKGKRTHLKALWHVWHFVRKRAALAPDEHGHAPRVYDLRHSFASIGAGGGLSLPIIGRLLGHTQARTTERYAHLADNPLREAIVPLSPASPRQ
jgi:integrase